MALVEVKPLPQKKWHQKEGKESFARPKTIEVLYDDATGKYATGLTPEEAKEYGEKLGVDLSDTFNADVPHPYWSSRAAIIPLPNATKMFNTNITSDLVKVKNMKAHKQVANSMEEYNNGKWPFATHVITDEQEEIQLKAGTIKNKNLVILEASKMSAERKCALILIIRNKNLKGHGDDFIDVEIDDIANDPKDAGLFLKYKDMEREQVTLRATILECIMRGVLHMDGTAVKYMGSQIGYDYEAAVTYLADPENQRIKVAIFEKLNSK